MSTKCWPSPLYDQNQNNCWFRMRSKTLIFKEWFQNKPKSFQMCTHFLIFTFKNILHLFLVKKNSCGRDWPPPPPRLQAHPPKKYFFLVAPSLLIYFVDLITNLLSILGYFVPMLIFSQNDILYGLYVHTYNTTYDDMNDWMSIYIEWMKYTIIEVKSSCRHAITKRILLRTPPKKGDFLLLFLSSFP